MEHFADRLAAQIEKKRSQIVVGLDPRIERIPPQILEESLARHGRTPHGAADAIERFNRAVIDAVAEHAAAIKCQIAFYERHGLAGLGAYASTLSYARSKGLLAIGDVKRSDIGSTAAAYAAAHLGCDKDDAAFCPPDFVADAITINPLLGSDGVAPFIEQAAEQGRGLFALVKTSNPSSAEIQDLSCDGKPLYERVAALVEQWGTPYRGECGYSLVGAVVGATFPRVVARLREAMPHTFFLLPGFGAQGAGVEDVLPAFDAEGSGAVVNSSRAITYAHERPPFSEEFGIERWQEAAAEAARRMKEQIWQATH